MKRDEMKYLKDMVHETLKEDEAARNCDNYLYLQVAKRINYEAITQPFFSVVINLPKYGLPSFETIGRLRRKVQEEHPDLMAAEQIEMFRTDNEEVFKALARNEVR